jgi:8-oxo-dGTP pyrophosphatase MutT (NUDIX family)
MSDELQPAIPSLEQPVEPSRAAGILCVTSTGHVLLVHRTDGQGWALPGGGIEEGEPPEEAARREFLEETGVEYEGALQPWTRRVRDGVDFTTFLARGDEFKPTLNAEHDAWQWVDHAFALAALPALHPGVPVALQRFTMDELGIAKAIQAEELTSPQRYCNLLLIAIRITGTGVAYRPAHDQFPFRDPAFYLTPEFLQRCNGLPVILEHPDAPVLNTEEFRERIVGTIFIPYIHGDEVWGIAKILDMKVADMLETEEMSTSPGVYCGGVKLQMRSGKTLLIEDKPELVDHIALLYASTDGHDKGGHGVWDKGQGRLGVESVDAAPTSEWDKLDLIVRQTKLHDLHKLAIE